jgi:hypothetical protein
MKRVIAVVLTCLLVAPPASAGQKPVKPMDWQKVQKLDAGTEVIVTVTGGQPTRARLLFVDEATLVTLKATSPKLGGRVEEFLFAVGRRWPAVLNVGLTCEDDPLRVSQRGIFEEDEELAELADVVQQTPRADVVEITKAPRSHSDAPRSRPEASHSHVGGYVLSFILGALLGFAALLAGSLSHTT